MPSERRYAGPLGLIRRYAVDAELQTVAADGLRQGVLLDTRMFMKALCAEMKDCRLLANDMRLRIPVGEQPPTDHSLAPKARLGQRPLARHSWRRAGQTQELWDKLYPKSPIFGELRYRVPER